MKRAILAAVAVNGAMAFPAAMMNDIAALVQSEPRQTTAEGNCGPTPCLVFNEAEQFVSITGKHAYASPLPGQIRGLCPGLNAASNHNYLPRSGILTIPQTITGLAAAYGMGADLAGFLAAYAVIEDGDIVSETWSIGGPMPANTLGGTLGKPQGISYSHNKYEGDVSIGRNDAYLNNGDAHSLNITRFAEAYATGLSDDRYTLARFHANFAKKQQDSVANNPYYFSPEFAGALVAPAAFNFVLNFMSNHTAAQPNGYLDGSQFKQFFAVSGDYPNFVWNKGQEQIPANWYRRTSTNPYTIASAVGDVLLGYKANPSTFHIGGNTNGVNTYRGVDLSLLTGGTYTNDNILKGNNFACLVFQAQQSEIPDFLHGQENNLAKATALFQKYTGSYLKSLNCPKLAKYDNSAFNTYPGRNYNPTGQDTTYKMI